MTGMGKTPREMLRAIVRGEPLTRPLLLPVVFSPASRLENLQLHDFLTNVTKIANALRQIRAQLKVDGVMCYWDAYLEVEAIAANAEWKAGSEMLASANAAEIGRLRQAIDDAGGIAELGRVPVALEVLRRLKTLMADEPVLMARATGPYTLAAQLFGTGNSLPSDLLQLAADITALVVNSYLQAGADLVFVVESAPPAESVIFDSWRTLVDPIVNTIRFFEALPVLFFDNQLSQEQWGQLRGHRWECALCLDPHSETLFAWQSTTPWLGAALTGLDRAHAEHELVERAASVLEAASPVQFFTSWDLPANADFKSLGRNLSALRNYLASAH